MRLRRVVYLLLAALLLNACSSTPASTATAGVTPTVLSPESAQPTVPPTATLPAPTPTTAPSPTPQTVTVLASDACQRALAEASIALPTQLTVGNESRVVSIVNDSQSDRDVVVRLVPALEAADPLAVRYLAAVVPFRSLEDEVASADLITAWTSGEGLALMVDTRVAPALTAAWGAPSDAIVEADLTADLLAKNNAVGLLGFEQLDPTFKVLFVDGQSVLSNRFDAAAYPLGVALLAEGDAGLVAQLATLADAWENRDPERLTQLIMTGVTAMCRLTAAKMEEHGYTYPAEVIGPVLREADITHVSNEVPFIQGCPVDTTSDSLVFCSDYGYWAALEAIGTDIVGLSGNHVNDHGYAGAAESLAYYQSLGVPVYGSGLNVDEACQPLRWTDHGNTFAFVAALAFDPQYAWATADQPGACYYYDNKERLLSLVRSLANEVDVVSVELQYYETYNPFPTAQQVVEFRELREAGADIVTGVQSHVPQTWEPYGADDDGGAGIIVYGLGNLFFDQMWSWETRTGLIARHTIYDGRLLSSEMLTTVLEDYAQPRWASDEERREILERVHSAAPDKDTTLYMGPSGSAVYATQLAIHAWLTGEYSTAAYWGLDELTDRAFAADARGGQVTAADWRVLDVEPEDDRLQVIVEFSDATCALDNDEYHYAEAHLSAVSVVVDDDTVQIVELRPVAAS